MRKSLGGMFISNVCPFCLFPYVPCQGALDRKRSIIQSLKPNILIVPESADLDSLDRPQVFISNNYWNAQRLNMGHPSRFSNLVNKD